jgi:hypothetical protein
MPLERTHPHGVRRSPLPDESLDDYRDRMKADRRIELRARWAALGADRTGDDG